MLTQSTSLSGDYLTYDDSKHSYNLNGEVVPGVTTIIHNSLPEAIQLVHWKIRQGCLAVANKLSDVDEITEKVKKDAVRTSVQAYKEETKKAANIGTIVHDYAETRTAGKSFDFSIINTHPDKEKIFNCINEFEKWFETTQDELLSAEEVVGSSKYMFAGKYDLLTKRKKHVILKDYKTSAGIYTSYFIQLAAYAMALEEWKGIKVDKLEIVRFGKKEGDFEFKEVGTKKKIKELQDQFIRCRKTYDFIKEFNL